MKKLILNCVFILMLSGYNYSQTVFLPNIGTEWHYAFGSHYDGNTTNHYIKYMDDSTSVVTGEKIKKLLATKVFFDDNGSYIKKIFIKQRNDSVFFMHNRTINAWQLLIDYNATAGQSWTYSFLSGNYVNTHTITVNAVTTLTINNQSLKALQVTCKYGTTFFPTTICERIGGMSFMLTAVDYVPNAIVDGSYLDKFLCYEDSTLGLKQFTAYPCLYTAFLGVKENAEKQIAFDIYPNPAVNVLNIRLNSIINQPEKAQIINSLGSLVKEADLSCNEVKSFITIADLPNGIYLLNLKNSQSGNVSKRFVVSR